jgi:hypothetical protein
MKLNMRTPRAYEKGSIPPGSIVYLWAGTLDTVEITLSLTYDLGLDPHNDLGLWVHLVSLSTGSKELC